MNAERADRALDNYERVLAVHPNDAEALYYRGNFLEELGRFAEAVESYERALAIRPDYAEALNNRGLALEEMGRLGDALSSYERALAISPHHVEALINRSLALEELGRFKEAVESYDRALAIRPDDAETLVNRGLALHRLKRFVEAQESYERALTIRPDYAEALINRGISNEELKRLVEAAQSHGRAPGEAPDDAEALNTRGNTLQQLKRFDEALASYDRALAVRPDYAEALINRGAALKELERLPEALESYDRALAMRPDFAEALNNRGNTLQRLKRFAGALESYDRALALRPDYAEALNNRAAALKELGRLAEALEDYDRALAVKPNYAEALNNRGVTLEALDRFAEAIDCYDRALAIKPDYAEALNNRGLALKKLGLFPEALASYEQALAVKPDFAEALVNAGIALQELARLDEALESFERALAVKPDYQLCQFNRGLLLLLIGQFAEGWRGYEWRRKKYDWMPRSLLGPEWTKGEPARRQLLFYSEQGLGDTIQFSRFAGFVAARGEDVILEVQAPLRGLLGSLDGVRVIRKGDPLPDYDAHLPLMSLPHVLGITPDSIPVGVPYLFAEPARVEDWAKRLPAGRFRVGIVWQGRPTGDVDKGRSIPLAAFAPLCQIPGLILVSLQKGDGVEQLANLPPGMKVETLGADFDAGPDAFLDSAAVIMNLDLVISCDTAIAHLAGALGRSFWMVLKQVPDWRWMIDREASPWYPTARLFRQTRRDDWDEVFERIAGELAHAVADKGDPENLSSRGAASEAETSRAAAPRTPVVSAEALYSRGNTLRELKRFEEALESYDRALAVRPDFAEALINRGITFEALERFEEALESYDRALAVRPDSPEAWNNRGNILDEVGRLEEALASYDRALAVRPDYPEALNNRGITLRGLGRFDEALESYNWALALRPNYQDCRFNRAHLLLLIGRFAEGWPEYEWRRKKDDWTPRSLSGAEWIKGEPAGKRLLFYSEQGLGDTIQFSRFAGFVAARGAAVMLEVQPALAGLLSSLDGVRVIRRGQPLPDYDSHLPLMSLPHILGITPKSMPVSVPYLFAEPARVEAWARCLPAGRFRVGIVWQGNPIRGVDKGRSIPLSAFAPLCQIPGVTLVSLQKAGVEQPGNLPAGMRVEPLGAVLDAGPDAFLDSAAVIMNLDLVIACDTAVAHLAGALGCPLWIVLKQVPDWRWMIDREDTPWYPTARLFRQTRGDDWDEVFARIATELTKAIQGKREARPPEAQAIAADKHLDALPTEKPLPRGGQPTLRRLWQQPP